jgi:hypothetical protein
MAACTEDEQAAPEAGTELQVPASVTEAPTTNTEEWQSDAFLQHMHRHAEQLDKLNLALATGDLDGAMTPAYWLSGHEAPAGIPPEWLTYLAGMRDAARQVEASTDIDTARTAAEQITVQCQGCHMAANAGPVEQPGT